MLAASLLFTGCSDFLDSKDNSNIAGDNFYLSEEDCKAATAPLYSKVWFHFNDKFYYGMGDGRGYNLRAPYSDYIYPFTDLNESGLTSPLVQAWESLYIVVQQANKVINGIKGGSMSESVKPQYIAEARFMRGVAYYYLGMLWGNVIGLAFYFIQKWFGLFRLDPETYYMDTVPVSFNLWLFLLLNVGTLLASIAMLLGPSYLITRIHPANSMRYE